MKSLKKIKTSKFSYYFLRGAVAIAAVLILIQGNLIDAMSTAGIFLLMTVPMFLKEHYKTKTPIELDIASFFFVYITLFLGSFNNYYERFLWFDEVLHLLSGILLGMIGFVLVYLLNERASKKLYMSPGFIAFFALSFSTLMGVLWEIFEFTGDSLFGFNMQESGNVDTMSDLILNLVGAFIVVALGYMWMKYRKRIPFSDNELINEDT